MILIPQEYQNDDTFTICGRFKIYQLLTTYNVFQGVLFTSTWQDMAFLGTGPYMDCDSFDHNTSVQQ